MADEPLRYPVGRFRHEGPVSAADLAAWTDEIAAFPLALREAVKPLSDARLATPYRPGGWTVRQTVHHLFDSHANAYLRCKWALTEDNPTIKPYDEGAWAELPDSEGPVSLSLDGLAALHGRWTLLLQGLGPEHWGRRFLHPDDGPVRLDRAAGVYAWHGRHHLAHITGLAAREGWQASADGLRP